MRSAAVGLWAVALLTHGKLQDYKEQKGFVKLTELNRSSLSR